MNKLADHAFDDNLFSARHDRDEALALVTDNAGPSWMDKALAEIIKVHGEVTGEKIRGIVTHAIGPPHHHNAWGAVVRTAIKRGILHRTGQRVNMMGPKSHARMTDVYVVMH